MLRIAVALPTDHRDLLAIVAFPIVFSPCQSKIFPRKEIAKGFVLSPPLDFAIMNDKGDATGKEYLAILPMDFKQ